MLREDRWSEVKVVIAEKEEATRRIADLLGGFREVEENGVQVS